MRKRTDKTFAEYNQFHDRSFGLKWGTAFALSELVDGVASNHLYATKENPLLPQMKREEIDDFLYLSCFSHKRLSIQLNQVDQFGRTVDNVDGMFYGEAYHDYFVFAGQRILWESVRNISLAETEAMIIQESKEIESSNR